MRLIAIGIYAGLCGVLVHCFFENIFEEPYMTAYFWGLAALLIIDDDRDKYNAYWDEFEKGIALARNSLPSEIGEVEDVYGGIEHGEYGAWL